MQVLYQLSYGPKRARAALSTCEAYTSDLAPDSYQLALHGDLFCGQRDGLSWVGGLQAPRRRAGGSASRWCRCRPPGR